ncbi:MAG: signal transduction histidine kinase [Ulvibacter sp.]|jgi:signal transduction histidine kinase
MSEKEVLLIVYFIAVIFLLVLFVLVFFFTFQKRKNKFLLERLEVKQKFDREIEKSKLEIQEQTLKNIAWELHDNIGQLLSVVNIQLNMLSFDVPLKNQEQITETKGVVNDAVQEIRTLSKILNSDVILKNGLATSLKLELERFNKLKFIEAEFTVEGDIYPINNSDEIIIFRILQEFFSNVIKHAKAKKLVVLLDYKKNNLEIQANDDGVGFDSSQYSGNSGLVTMKSRASMIAADFNIVSHIKEGTSLYLKYPY